MWWEYLRIARRVLSAHKFRSTLTVLSITIGAFSIVTMSSLAESGLSTLRAGIDEIGGARLIDLGAKPPERSDRKRESYFRGLTQDDRDALFAALPHLQAKTMWSSLWRRDIVADTGRFSRSDVLGVDGGFLSLFHMKLARGRGITDEDDAQHAKVCLVGHKTAQLLFAGDAVGHWLTTQQGARCRVVGQLANQERWGVNFGFDWMDLVVLPLHTIADADPLVMPAVSVTITTDDAKHNEVVKRIMNSILVERHRGVDDFQIFDFSTFMGKFDSFFKTMQVIVGFIAGIALLVGGIGVMNMMLVSVSERVREIGIRKALGASPRDITLQFLIESALMSGTGGFIGVAGGVGTSLLAGMLIKATVAKSWVNVVATSSVVTALVVSIGIGLIFGIFPARRAGALSAIEAMRR